VRAISTGIAVLLLGGVGVFWWQRSQILSLRREVDTLRQSQQELADLAYGGGEGKFGASVRLAASHPATGLRRAEDPEAVFRAQERRLILDQYRDVLAELNLPPATASRLQDLLTDRVETVLDAEDAAKREGFAEGSAEMAQAITVAIATFNRQIGEILGPDGAGRLTGYTLPPPAPAPSPAPPAPVTVVNVFVPAAPPSAYGDVSAVPAVDSDASSPYLPYYYPSFATVVIGRNGGRRSGGAERPHPGGSARVGLRRR